MTHMWVMAAVSVCSPVSMVALRLHAPAEEWLDMLADQASEVVTMSRTGTGQLDPTDPQAKAALERLRRERAGWLTTVAPDGTPQSSPVWFIWDDGDLYLYSRRSPRVSNVRQNPRVSFNLDGNRMGGKVVVLEGTAIIDERAPSVDQNEQYLGKYGPVMEERDWSPEWFAENYPVHIRIQPTRFRYW